MSISRWAFRNGRGLLMTAVFVSVLGLLVGRVMPAAILPDFAYPRIVVIGAAGDMAIPDVEVRVTRPLEAAVNGVPGAKRVVSKTTRGAVEMSVDFDWGTDMFEALTRLNAAVAAARSSLPPEAALQVEWVNPSSFPIIGYSLTSDQRPARELLELAQLTIAPYLSRLEGVYRILVQGGQTRELQVLVDTRAAAAAGVSLQQVTAALQNTNLLQSVGRFSQHTQSTLVLADSQLHNAGQIQDVVVVRRGSTAIRVRDIARVREGDRDQTQVVTADGREAVLLNILKQPGASTNDVSDEVAAALRELRATLPADVQIRAFYDESELLRDSLGSLRDSIALGAALALLVLFAFLRSARGALVVFLCLPVTVLTAILGLKLGHQTLNIMTLGGLAVGLGLIIDDVVVTLENIHRHLEMGKPPRQAALDGASEIQKPMVGSTLTTVAVFLPLAFLSEITGAFFAPLSLTLTILLLVSVGLALTLVPLVCARLLPRMHPHSAAEPEAGGSHVRALARSGAQEGSDGSDRSDPWVPSDLNARTPDRPIAPRFGGLIRDAVERPAAVVALAALFAIACVVIFRTLPSGFMPEMDEGAFVLDYMAPAGTTLEDTDRQLRLVETELRATPEIASYSRRTGLEMGFFITDPNRGDIMVKLKPRRERSHSMTEVMDDVRHRCEERMPGMTFETVAPLADRVADIAGEPSPIEVKIFGDDPAVLEQLAGSIEKIVASIRGATESVHEVTRGGPELNVRINELRAARAGLSPRDVASALEVGMFGQAATIMRSGERLIAIRVMTPVESRRTKQQVGDFPILGGAGQPVPLTAVADLSHAPGTYELTRENQKPMFAVTASLEGRDLGSANAEVRRRIEREIKLPPGYILQYGGLYRTQQDSFRSLLTVLLMGMALVYIVTLYQYNRFAQPTALVIGAALAALAVAPALALAGTPFNASSFTGAIMIFGMVLTNGIVLMDMIDDEIRAGLTLADAIIVAGTRRVRPVLMTASIAVLALLPLAFGIGAGAEMQKPLAVAVIGGLAVSPAVTLFVLPALLLLIRRERRGALR